MSKPRMTDLGDLLGRNQPERSKQEAPVPQEKLAANKPAPKATVRTEPRPVGVPRYLTLVRKELRITEDQADQISRTVRSLNLSRQGEGERITDNTLFRLGISLLIERLGDLHGTTEAELHEALGLTYVG